ncbi:hypothetical protein AB6A40_003384 [Gnathostoma spinigerum]|uniref:Potassium channel domain-containing protein n=1 Tax=Gnathostoma spinigerum TaxID=75299 RepID=A0ABD6EAL4_9BILA
MGGVQPKVELALRRTLFFSIFVLLYLLLGAFGFYILPRRQRSLACEENTERLDAHRSEMLNVLWSGTMAQSEHDWAHMANQKLDIYENALLSLCKPPPIPPRSFLNSFLHSFSLVTTVGLPDVETLTWAGKAFAMLYASFGIPLTMLYLGQCSKMISGLLPGDRALFTALVTVFLSAVLYDIVGGTKDDTPFLDAVLHVFLTVSTVGDCSGQPTLTLSLVCIFAISLCSIAFVVIERHIENCVQGMELAFGRQFGSLSRWLNASSIDDDRIIEEDEDQTEDD